MKKLICLLFVFTFILTSLCSCHGSDGIPAFELPESFDTNEPIEITFWAKSDTNVAMSDVYRKAIADFQKIYPNITVKLKLYTDYGRIYNDVITNIPTMTTPNVCITYPDHIATYITGENVVVPIGELMNDSKFGLGGSEVKFDSPAVSEVTKKFLDEGKVGGVQYALPFMRSSEVCYINKTFVEKLGYTLPEILTWDFIWEVSEAANKKELVDGEEIYSINGQKVMIPFIYKSTDNMMIQMLKQKGADYSTDNGDILLFNDVTRDILYTVRDHAATGAFSTFKISSYPANFLNAGQCIFAIDSTAGATWMGTDAPNSDIDDSVLVDFETVVMPLPQFDIQNPQMISQGPSICLFNKQDPQEVLASWLFMQFLLTDEIQIAYAMTEGYVPVTDKARENESYLDYLSREGENNSTYYDIKIKATKIVLENTENTFITPVFNGSASVRNAAGQMIENITKQANRNKEVNDQYITELYSKMTSLYALDSLQDNQVGGSTKQEFGKLPTMSIILIVTLILIWILLAIYTIFQSFKKKIGQK
ncbi:MAG: extracellular solute-binding protein [Ruminococcaceae bacterium]|nr:extracellular solute-binding protein [Oscillospiraceae bacterium]